MADLTLDKLAKLLATSHGGYTVWMGAGACIALTKGKCPSWTKLIDLLRNEQDADGNPTSATPDNWQALDYPGKLEWIASQLGHARFRKGLRKHIVDPMLTAEIDDDVARQMSIIGLRAGGIVSFNIELVSAVAISAGIGGSMVMRPYTTSGFKASAPGFHAFTDEGTTASPVFFPHGLLDTVGDCVMTESEYLAQGMSLAATTAVNQCLGGDLLILGMSLGDRYLREAIVRHRNSIREIFWVTNSGKDFGAWARVANVHCVRDPDWEVWKRLADAIRAHDKKEEVAMLNQGNKGLAERAVRAIPKIRDAIARYATQYPADMAAKLAEPQYDSPNFVSCVRHLEDLGLDVPKSILDDPRYIEGWTTGRDPYAQHAKAFGSQGFTPVTKPGL